MKYLKKFNTHSDYATFTGSTDFILPNVSVCVNEDEVHFSPIVIDTHECVDLGLPSGTLWATENIKDGNGNELYFAWGETQGYTSGQVGAVRNFSWKYYEFGIENNLSKYNGVDIKTLLEPTDDAATVNWDSNWRMPTQAQFSELIANTTTAWTQVGMLNGLLCTSTANTNTLFFPAFGFVNENGLENVGCNYWSASLSLKTINNACQLFSNFKTNDCGVYETNRYIGCCVRPVRTLETKTG